MPHPSSLAPRVYLSSPHLRLLSLPESYLHQLISPFFEVPSILLPSPYSYFPITPSLPPLFLCPLTFTIPLPSISPLLSFFSYTFSPLHVSPRSFSLSQCRTTRSLSILSLWPSSISLHLPYIPPDPLSRLFSSFPSPLFLSFPFSTLFPSYFHLPIHTHTPHHSPSRHHPLPLLFLPSYFPYPSVLVSNQGTPVLPWQACAFCDCARIQVMNGNISC